MPAYRFHVSGQAVVTLAGKDFYLGPHDSPESRARYFELVQEYNANGKIAPKTTPRRKTKGAGTRDTRLTTITESSIGHSRLAGHVGA